MRAFYLSTFIFVTKEVYFNRDDGPFTSWNKHFARRSGFVGQLSVGRCYNALNMFVGTEAELEAKLDAIRKNK